MLQLPQTICHDFGQFFANPAENIGRLYQVDSISLDPAGASEDTGNILVFGSYHCFEVLFSRAVPIRDVPDAMGDAQLSGRGLSSQLRKLGERRLFARVSSLYKIKPNVEKELRGGM
jgi:hypothetical protein